MNHLKNFFSDLKDKSKRERIIILALGIVALKLLIIFVIFGLFADSISARYKGSKIRGSVFSVEAKMLHHHMQAEEYRSERDKEIEEIAEKYQVEIDAEGAEYDKLLLTKNAYIDVLVNTEAPLHPNIYFTAYNAEEGQTDSTPCIAGGTGYNVCEMYKKGQRVIALSQEMIQWSQIGKRGNFKKGDRVILKSTTIPNDWRCNGEFIVGDAMNIRWRNRGDIFMLDRADNLDCNADIYKLTY